MRFHRRSKHSGSREYVLTFTMCSAVVEYPLRKKRTLPNSTAGGDWIKAVRLASRNDENSSDYTKLALAGFNELVGGYISLQFSTDKVQPRKGTASINTPEWTLDAVLTGPHCETMLDFGFANLAAPAPPIKQWDARIPYATLLCGRISEVAVKREVARWNPPIMPPNSSKRRESPISCVTKLLLNNNQIQNADGLVSAVAPYLPFHSWACLKVVDFAFNALTEIGEQFWLGLPKL
eukprot:SAG31_NODE_5629_length_2415_cov_0.883420_1_plen_235_part_10